MTEKNINTLKKAMENCINNAEGLLHGGDHYPTIEEILQANVLLETAKKIDDIIVERS